MHVSTVGETGVEAPSRGAGGAEEGEPSGMKGPTATMAPTARGAFVLGLVCALLGVLWADSGARAQSGRFTAEERRRLVAGELVRRATTRTEHGSRYIGGTSWQRVRAPQSEVWSALLDIRQYPRLIPGVVEARLVEARLVEDRAVPDRAVADRGSDRVIFLRHRYSFIHAAYFAKMHIDEGSHTVRFELDRSRPHDVEDGRGFITVAPYRGRESIVTWGVLADVGAGLITGVLAPLLHDWILRVPWCVRGHFESDRPGC